MFKPKAMQGLDPFFKYRPKLLASSRINTSHRTGPEILIKRDDVIIVIFFVFLRSRVGKVFVDVHRLAGVAGAIMSAP